MKQAIDNNGNLVEVSDNTIVSTTNGTHYLLTPQEQAEYNAREALEASKESLYETEKVYAKRVKEYGTMGYQLDLMYHEGFQAWVDHIAEVKIANPLPL